MKRFGLIGFPLTHSFSANYFTEKFNSLGLKDHVYELFPIQSIGEIIQVISANPDLRGLNVTIPYKQVVVPYLDFRDTLPKGISACNCISIRDGKLTGFNTDVLGFEKSFAPKLKPYHNKALILGNGGATEAVRFVLDKLGISYKVVSRLLREGSSMTYTDIDKNTLEEYTIIINTSPVGMYPDTDNCPPIPYGFISEKHYLFDLIYNPAKTLFLQKGEQRGAIIKSGYEMLLIQAEESWNIWNA